jgi:purine-cytosine permease-like protein
MADGSSIDWHKPVTLSTGGIISIVAMNLAGFVNLPTFFRHAKSHSHAFSGLSIFVISLIAFQLLALGVGYSTIESIQQLSGWNQWLMTLFLLFSLIGVNIVNIYFASAGWEMILPHRRSPKEYAIVGLLGTLAYAFLQISAPMEFLENVAEHFIASLGVALLFAFLIRIVVRHRPRPREKLVNLVCWLAGGLVGLGLQVERMDDPNRAMVGAVCATAVAFLVAIFVEETVWSVRTVWRE